MRLGCTQLQLQLRADGKHYDVITANLVCSSTRPFAGHNPLGNVRMCRLHKPSACVLSAICIALHSEAQDGRCKGKPSNVAAYMSEGRMPHSGSNGASICHIAALNHHTTGPGAEKMHGCMASCMAPCRLMPRHRRPPIPRHEGQRAPYILWAHPHHKLSST
jgi:hypothetical protein